MSETIQKQTYRCTDCGEGVYVERWSGAGLVLTCGCEVSQSIKTNSTLPERWEK